MRRLRSTAAARASPPSTMATRPSTTHGTVLRVRARAGTHRGVPRGGAGGVGTGARAVRAKAGAGVVDE
eukprot:5005857-Prymnesium_polylepis.1